MRIFKKLLRRGAPVLSALVLALLLSGCLFRSPDKLYALPQQPDAYYNLQSAIDGIVTGGVNYCAPTSGENQQPLQIRDIDGDGKNEALVFAKTGGEKPLKIYIFNQTGDQYTLSSTIEGSGSGFDSVQYAQMDDTPGLELVVGRRISDQVVKSLSVYALKENSLVELLSTNYSACMLTDLDSDGLTDLFLLRPEAETETSEAELYRYKDGIISRDPELVLSCATIRRVITGYTDTELPAVFVAGTAEDSTTVTDVFVVRDGALYNLAKSGSTANVTVRSYAAYAADLDGDGLTELPEIETLRRDRSDEPQNVIRWYNLCGDGTKRYKMLTYHDYTHGFFLPLEMSWLDGLSIVRDSTLAGGTAYRFCLWKSGGAGPEEQFTLYLFSGENRAELAEAEGRFLLADKNDIVYAASVADGAQITEDQLRQSFQFIRMDWKSGEM